MLQIGFGERVMIIARGVLEFMRLVPILSGGRGGVYPCREILSQEVVGRFSAPEKERFSGCAGTP